VRRALRAGALLLAAPALRAGALLLTAALAAGCSGSGQAGDGEGGSRATTVRFTLFGDAVETRGYQQMVEDFERTAPGIDVVLSPVAKQDDLLARLTTSFAGGRPPDVFLVNYRRYGQFAAQGALDPVGPRLAASDALDEGDFAPTALEAFRYDGRELTCLPQNVSSLQVYYNADLFREAGLPAPRAGWTWSQFRAAAQRLTGDGRYGLGTEISLPRLAPFVWSGGGQMVDDQVAPTTLTVDSLQSRRGLDFFLDLADVAPPQREESSQDSEARFLAGTLGMILDSRKATPTFRTIRDFEWDVAPLPVAPGGEQATVLHGDAYCVSKAGQRDAAWRFVEYANSAAGQRVLAASGRTVPSRLDVAASPDFLRPGVPPASSEVFADAVPTIRSLPHLASWSRVEKEGDELLEAIFYGRVSREDGVRQLVERTRPLLASAGP